MLRIKSIKLSTVYRAILGMSIVCSSAFAQGLNSGPTPPPTPGPTPIPHSFPTPTPNPIPFASPSPSPAPGVQKGDRGKAIACLLTGPRGVSINCNKAVGEAGYR